MVLLRAYQSLNLLTGSTDYIPPASLTDFVSASPKRLDFVDPQGRLQEYYGVFNLPDLLVGKYDTSTFEAYRQYDGFSDFDPLMFEFNGASLNGQVVYDYIQAGDVRGLLSDLFGGDDLFDGSQQNDTLLGFGGQDILKGNAGGDLMSGNGGNDLVSGNQGLDTMFGGYGDDTVRGGQDNDALAGLLGLDWLLGNQGDDTLVGGDDNDRLNGNQGNDTSKGGQGADVFVLSKDFDLIEDFNASEGDTIEVLASTPYTLGSSLGGDVQIIRDVGITTLAGVTLESFDPSSIITI